MNIKKHAVKSVLKFIEGHQDKKQQKIDEEKRRQEEEKKKQEERKKKIINQLFNKQYRKRNLVIIGIFFVIILILSFIGAPSEGPDNIGKINMPASSSNFEGENYQDVITELKDAGFTNIKTAILGDLITGWVTKDGEVKQIDINGKTEFDSGTSFPKDSKIVITYHTFPKTEKTVAKPVDKPVDKPIDKPVVVPPVESTEEILTAKNNKDLAHLLTNNDEADPSISAFAKKYFDKTIEFDGNIANTMNYKDYKTRYDFLVYVGNYSKTSANGPSFKFENVNFYDLHFTGSNIPDYAEEGQNIHVIAKVVSYNQDTGLFFLKPVSTKLR